MRINTIKNGNSDVLQIDDARICYRNLEGRGDRYNHAGDRNFSVVISDPEIADQLIEDGWNVKIKAGREEGDQPFMTLPVKIKGRVPSVYLQVGRNRTKLKEDSFRLIDQVTIDRVCLDVRAFDWDMDGKVGRTAYLNSMLVYQQMDRFADWMAEEEHPEDDLPFN